MNWDSGAIEYGGTTAVPTIKQVTDAAGHVWELRGSDIYLDGVQDASGHASNLALLNGIAYFQILDGNWWWKDLTPGAETWIKYGPTLPGAILPEPAPTPTPTPQPVPEPVPTPTVPTVVQLLVNGAIVASGPLGTTLNYVLNTRKRATLMVVTK